MARKNMTTMGMGTFVKEGKDISKHGASPGVKACWDKMKKAIDAYPDCNFKKKQELLKKYPEITFEVMCPECGKEY